MNAIEYSAEIKRNMENIDALRIHILKDWGEKVKDVSDHMIRIRGELYLVEAMLLRALGNN